MTEHLYKLTYFGIRGLAEQMRLLMHDQGIPFEDNRVTFEDWKELKPTMQFGQLPCLTDGSNQIVQSGAIMRHLARKHDLYGDNEVDQTYVDMFYEGVRDLHTKYSKMIYTEYEEKKDDFVKNVLPVELAKLEALLKTREGGKQFVCGKKLTFVDFTLYEELDALQVLDENCLNQFPLLHCFYERMATRPNLQDYLKERTLAKININGNGKQ